MTHDEITTLDPAGGRVLNSTEVTRRSALLERIVATPPTPRRRTRRAALAGVGTAVGLLVAGAVFAPVAATATWTLQPTHPTEEQSLQMGTDCAENWDAGIDWPAVTSDDILLSERRGESGLTIMRMGATVIQCTDIGSGSPGWEALGDGYSAAPGRIMTMSRGTSGDPGASQYSSITGLAGEGVTGVDVIGFDGVIRVQATVESGWFTAWWPGGSGGDVEDQDTVTVHTEAGSTSFTLDEISTDPGGTVQPSSPDRPHVRVASALFTQTVGDYEGRWAVEDGWVIQSFEEGDTLVSTGSSPLEEVAADSVISFGFVGGFESEATGKVYAQLTGQAGPDVTAMRVESASGVVTDAALVDGIWGAVWAAGDESVEYGAATIEFDTVGGTQQVSTDDVDAIASRE